MSMYSSLTPIPESFLVTNSGNWRVRMPRLLSPTAEDRISDLRQLRFRHWLETRPRMVPAKLQDLGAPDSSRFRLTGG